jgi:hypothetical protein
MSDLAPFVAAAIRDKVVQELMKENEAMRKQVAKLRQFKTVEITGPGGNPVYTRAQFDEDGCYNGNPNLWSVHFPEGKQLFPCPLPMLEGIQVRLGGAGQAAFNNNSTAFETSLDEDRRDHENGKVVSFCFSGGSSSLWLVVMVDGWPRERWQATIDEGIDGEEPLGNWVQTVAAESPTGKKVIFLEVDFFVTSVRGIIESLDNNPDAQANLQQRREELTFLEIILTRMRAVGNDAGPSQISAQALAILSALERVGVRGPGELFELSIDPLLQSQMRRTREGFELFVNDLVSCIREGRQSNGAGNGV